MTACVRFLLPAELRFLRTCRALDDFPFLCARHDHHHVHPQHDLTCCVENGSRRYFGPSGPAFLLVSIDVVREQSLRATEGEADLRLIDARLGVELLVGAGRFLRELHQRLSCWLCEPVAKCQSHHWKGELKVLEGLVRDHESAILELERTQDQQHHVRRDAAADTDFFCCGQLGVPHPLVERVDIRVPQISEGSHGCRSRSLAIDHMVLRTVVNIMMFFSLSPLYEHVLRTME